MPDIEEVIKTSLHRQAGQVDTSRRLAEEAYNRGRKIRTIRRVTAAVACAAALAVGVPLGIQQIGADGRHTPVEPADTAPARTESPTPTPTTTPTPRATVPQKSPQPPTRTTPPNPPSHTASPPPPPAPKLPVEINVDYTKLPRGADPKVPWFGDGVIHDGGRRIPVPGLTDDSYVYFAETASGFVVNVACCEIGPQTYANHLIRSDGTVIRTLQADIVDVPVVSADGRMVAWTEEGATEDDPLSAVVVDAATGRELTRRQIDVAYPVAVGFVGSTVVLSESTVWDEPSRTLRWNVENNTLSSESGTSRPIGTDGTRRLLLRTRPDGPGGGCMGMYDTERGRLAWENCDLNARMFSYEGRYADGRDAGKDQYDVLDARTGRTVAILGDQASGMTLYAAEPDGAMLFVASSGSSNPVSALVRCGLDGRCERASDIRSLRDSPGQAFTLPGGYPR